MEMDTSARYVEDSIEGQINLKHVYDKEIFGTYASFTKTKWKDKNPPDGEYACITSGVFLVDGILVAVTYFSNDLDGEIYQEGLSMIQSLASR